MTNRVAAIVVGLLLAAGGQASEGLMLKSQSELWSDESMSLTVAKTLIRGAKDEKAVRAQLAGTNDSFFKTGLLFAPDEVRVGTFQSYPAFMFRGVSLANFTRRRCSVTVVFTAHYTYTIHCFAPEAAELPDAEKIVRIEGEPSAVTGEAFRFLEPKVREGLAEMGEMVRKLAAANAKSG